MRRIRIANGRNVIHRRRRWITSTEPTMVETGIRGRISVHCAALVIEKAAQVEVRAWQERFTPRRVGADGCSGPLKLVPHLASVDPAGTAAAEVSVGAPVKPEAVAEDSVLSGLWDEVVPALLEAGMVSRVDGPALEMAFRHFRAAGRPRMSWSAVRRRCGMRRMAGR